MKELVIIIELIIIIIACIKNIIDKKDMLKYKEYTDRLIDNYKKEIKEYIDKKDNLVVELQYLKAKLEEEKNKNKKAKTKNENKIKKLSKEYEKLLEKYNLINTEEKINEKEQEEKQEGKLEFAFDGKIIDDKIVDIENKQKEIEPLVKKSTKTKKVTSEEKEEKKTTTKRTRKTKKTEEEK